MQYPMVPDFYGSVMKINNVHDELIMGAVCELINNTDSESISSAYNELINSVDGELVNSVEDELKKQ